MVKILGKRVELEILGNAVHAPGLGIRLKSAKQDLACVFLVVGALVRHPQHRQIRGEPVDAFGHDVKVLAGMKRHGDAGLGADLTGPHSARIDNVVGLDRALIRHHASHPAIGFMDVGDLDALNDLHAEIARALGKRLGDIHRIGLTVLRQKDTADHIIDLQPRITAVDIGGGYLVNFDPEGARHGRRPPELFHPLVGQRHGHRPVPLEAGGDSRFILETEIEFLRIFCQPGHVLGRP